MVTRKGFFFRYIAATVVAASLFISCCDDDEKPEPEIPNRTVLVYLGVDNNFAGEDVEKVDTLKHHWKGEHDGNLLVYADSEGRFGRKPVLLHIREKSGRTVVDTVAVYESENSASPVVFNRVLTDVQAGWPAESYGLVVLSHGTGWLPDGMMANPRSIIQDGNVQMEIGDFAEAIPYRLDFIVFDACLMAGVEVAYELKDKTDYLVFSAAEVLVPGFPYNTMMGHLMKPEADVVALARDFYDFFADYKYPYATVSVVKTAELDGLADVVSAQLQGIEDGEVSIAAIQDFGYGANSLYFDLADYMEAVEEYRVDAEFSVSGQMQALYTALDRCVIYKANTPNYYTAWGGQVKPVRAHCGLTSYIPQTKFPLLNGAYRQMKWTKRINL